MDDPGATTVNRRTRRQRGLALVGTSVLLLSLFACGGDDDEADASNEEEATSGQDAEDLLGAQAPLVDQSVRTLELSVLAKYAFSLAQSFNGFYHKYSILNEEREDTRVWRAAAVSYYKQQLTKALELMGCVVPPKM